MLCEFQFGPYIFQIDPYKIVKNLQIGAINFQKQYNMTIKLIHI
jgi:hypothetical protein